MSTFETNIRRTNLENLHTQWNEQKIEEFYGSHITNYLRKAAFQQHEDGYIIAEVNMLEYVNVSNGHSYKIRPTNEASWSKFTALHQKSTELGTFRVETPAHRSVQNTKEYIELSSPNNEFGLNLVSEMQAGNIATADDAKAWIDSYFSTLQVILSAAKDISNGLYPKSLFSIENYWKDSQGYYFTNIDEEWNTSVEDGMNIPLIVLQSVASQKLANDDVLAYEQQIGDIIDAIRNS